MEAKSTKDIAMKLSTANQLNLPNNGSFQRATMTEIIIQNVSNRLNAYKKRSDSVMDKTGKLGLLISAIIEKASNAFDENFINGNKNSIINPANENNNKIWQNNTEWQNNIKGNLASLDKLLSVHAKGKMSDGDLLEKLRERDSYTRKQAQTFTTVAKEFAGKQVAIEPRIEQASQHVRAIAMNKNITVPQQTSQTGPSQDQTSTSSSNTNPR